MDEFNRIFLSYTKYRIIICASCHFAVVPSQVEQHLKKHHSRLTRQQRHAIAETIHRLPQLAHVSSDVIYPQPHQPAIDTLPISFDGLKCMGKNDRGEPCEYICRTACGIQKHCKEEHGWVNVQKRGGDVRAKQSHTANKLWECNRACQRFFKVGKWQRYFEVNARDLEADRERNLAGKEQFFQARRNEIAQTAQDFADAAKIVEGFDKHRSTVVPWLRETGIAEHISGLNKDEIREAIALPSPDQNDYLSDIIEGMESLLREAHGLCFDGSECMLTWPCRVVLSRFQPSQIDLVGKTRAFDPYKEQGTLKTYFRLAHRFVSYFHRVVAPDDYHFSAKDGEEERERPEDIVEATDEQLALWQQIWRTAKQKRQDGDGEAGEETIGQLKAQLLEFWMLVVCHPTGARRYQSPLLSFCAMLGIKPSTSGWMEPGNFNSNLSGIIWVVQLLIFYDSARREQQGRGQTLTLVKRRCNEYLEQTVEAPMGEILRWRLLLFKVSKESVGDHEVSWDESEQVLTYEDTELHMDQIPILLSSEYRNCQRLLYDDLMLGQGNLRRMHAWALKDGPNVDTVDWNFTQQRENAHLLKGADTALLNAIEQSKHLSHLFLADDRQALNGFVWRESSLAAYEATVQEFLKRLSVLVHVSGGQPVRESEFFEMTWRNTQRRRSISIRHDRIMIHTKYHKGQQQTGRHKENVHFLANPVGDLLLDYIVYVMSLRQVFLRQASPKSLLAPFLWEKDGKVWPEGQLSRCMEEASTRACIPRLHVSNWRQMTVAIVKKNFASRIECFHADDNDEDAEEMDEVIRAMTKQRNHKTRTVNRAYANQAGASFSNLWDGQIRMALQASMLWQDFWGVEMIMKSKKRKIDEERVGFTKRVAAGIYRPRKPWSADALLGAMREFYGNEEAGWRSAEQEQAMVTIMSRTEQVVAILPTGAGKSLLFMLPCTLPDAGITILIVPLVALRGDLLRRIRDAKIDYVEWKPGEAREAALIVVSVEAAYRPGFMKYARGLVAQQKLERIVVDECHLTVTAANYRESIVDLTMIRSLRTQFVYLTATLPPSMMTEFEERNHLYHPVTIRASSNRPNIFYMVRTIDSRAGDILEQAAAEARQAWVEASFVDQDRDKIILYVRTREEAGALAEKLGCEMYTSKSGTEEVKAKALDRWTSDPSSPYIVATTALAEGFDYPHVRYVINVNEPDSLVTFAQETGRAGRDGNLAYSLVMLPGSWQAQVVDKDHSQPCEASHKDDLTLRRQREREGVHRYLKGVQCYRTSLTEELDVPQHRRWCMEEDAPCEICRTSHDEPIQPSATANEDDMAHTGLKTIQQQQLRAHSELVRYRMDLAAVRGTCLLCRTMEEEWDHDFSSCPRRHDLFQERSKARQRQQERGRQWLKRFTSCYWCLNPQSICQRASEGTGGKGSERCENGDVVLPICYGIFKSMGGGKWMKEEFGREFANIEDFFDWLAEESEFGGGKSIQAVRLAARALLVFEG